MDTNARIKDAMRQRMAEQGISQGELARRLGIKQPSVAGVLSHGRARVPQSLIDVLEALDLELTVVPKHSSGE